MASCRKVDNMMGVAVAIIITVGVAAVVDHAEARPGASASASCSAPDEYVFPYWSLCGNPATLKTEYYYVSTAGSGGLAPEWDESNSTYYVRLSDDSEGAAPYVAAIASSEDGDLLTDFTVYIFNAVTQRALQWRQEGSNEYFLTEQAVSSLADGAPFRFLKADGVLLPCPLIYPPAQCNAYYLVSNPTASSTFPSTGLLAFQEDSVTYIKNAPEGSVGDLPLLQLTASSSILKRANTMHPFLPRRPTSRSASY